MLWLIFKFDSPYYQEIIKIIGQKLIIFIHSFVLIIQAYGAKKRLSLTSETETMEIISSKSIIT